MVTTMNGKSDAYKVGYYAYMSWYWSHNTDRPANPYSDQQADDWQQGWDDASFDVF